MDKKQLEAKVKLLEESVKVLSDDVKRRELERLELTNAIECLHAGMTPGIIKDWAPATIDMVIRQAGDANFMQEAKVMTIDGKVKVSRGSNDYIDAVLRECTDENMKYTLIEECPRVAKVIDKVYFADAQAHVVYTDGSITSHDPEKPRGVEVEDDEDWGEDDE